MDDRLSEEVSAQDAVTETVELLDRYKGGDEEALNRLFDRYYMRVRLVVRSKIGRSLRGRTDIDDLVQRTFLNALSSIATFEHRSEGAFMRWLATIAINQIRGEIDYLKAGKRDAGRDRALESLRAFASSSGGGYDPAGDSTLPPEAAARDEAAEIVVDALDRLPEHYREVILLRDYMNMSFAEIAAEMGRETEGAATMLHARARIALSKEVKRRFG